jgi:UDP-glucose 4-epimerase
LPARALEGCDALIHAAGVIDEDFADRGAAFRKAREGTRTLLSAARHAGVRRLAYVSSAHVYGPLAGRIDEATTPDPRSDYAIAHREAESAFEAACSSSDANVLIARPCAVFGMPPDLERFARWSLIPFSFPREAISGTIVLKSPGVQRRNFVSIEGVAGLVGGWLQAPGPGLTVANAPGPHEMAVYDFAGLCARIAEDETGRSCEVRRPEVEPERGPPFEYRTRVGGPLSGTPLEDHVRTLIAALSKKKEAS